LAIWRIAAMVPTWLSAAGSGSSVSVFWKVRNSRRSAPSARLTDSIEAGRVTASGCIVSGKTTVCLSARTGNSLG
jgi:hypothetical protein